MSCVMSLLKPTKRRVVYMNAMSEELWRQCIGQKMGIP
jgi:hypothetical protein